MNILFATSEVFPLIKTGGLADVSYNLPTALHKLGHSVSIVLPAYRSLRPALNTGHLIERCEYFGEVAEIWRTSVGTKNLPLLLIHCPRLFDRAGGPYSNDDHQSWSDNALRFGLFSRVIAAMASGEIELGFSIDVLHCNDWQTGLAPVFLSPPYSDNGYSKDTYSKDKPYSKDKQRPKIVFTIHNLAYQGLFSRADFDRLGLPDELWSYDQVEFYNQLSFMKGGIVFADTITTVSPQYRREILTVEFGCGLEDCLSYHQPKLRGILNGIDTEIWNPEKDPAIAQCFNAQTLADRKVNKDALLKQFRLAKSKALLIGIISRLADQKGIDLVLESLPELIQLPIQLVVLGDGEQSYRDQLDYWATHHPDKIGLYFGYNEGLAHQFVAGLDALLIPSRYEPCGLTQMYAMRYGCIPIAHAVGGLVDTITNTSQTNEQANDSHSTGILFTDYRNDSLIEGIKRAIDLRKNDGAWLRLQTNAMSVDNSWHNSALKYLEVYQQSA